MSQRRIAVLTLSMAEPRLMLAGAKDGQLHIIECKRLERSLHALKKALPEKLESLRKKGFVLLVDEVVPCFAQYGRSAKLSDIDAQNKPVVVSAMEAYQNLSAYQAIHYPKGLSSSFEISPSLIEEVKGPDGKASYHINWAELKPDTVALLFAVYAATQESLFDHASITELFKRIQAKPKVDPHQRFRNIIKKVNDMGAL
ncbi:hypothetical protein [Vibrio marisflavi]|uniref:Maturation control protein n=1 Tax=Vibrio marisflavi CECT 7928 TaxID=634439 RepID=A0ABM9A9H6_9VIBR|nr:hypothetical protein [Vibrio marisflavi]CAH0543003.1 hypothetical protein VMF7928_04355 [Vibrio marisflavi CECT 7928]